MSAIRSDQANADLAATITKYRTSPNLPPESTDPFNIAKSTALGQSKQLHNPAPPAVDAFT